MASGYLIPEGLANFAFAKLLVRKIGTKIVVNLLHKEHVCLRAAAEDLADLQRHHRAKVALASGEDGLIPAEYVNRLLHGENDRQAYRDLRGLTQATLAENAGVNRVMVAEIGTGCKQGSVATLRALSDALGSSFDDLAE